LLRFASFVVPTTSQTSEKNEVKTETEKSAQRAKFLVHHALEEDEAGNNQEASELYMQAAELCIKVVRVVVLLRFGETLKQNAIHACTSQKEVTQLC